MAKQDIETTEYTWDDGTYQTGAAQPDKRQSGIIAGLLAATIFLGGIASALGIMNIRLLQQLSRPTEPVLPVSVDMDAEAGDLLRENPDHAPVVPENGRLELQLGDGETVMTYQQLQDRSAAVTARITMVDSQGQEKTGTALILSSDGYLLTNAHLTDSALSVVVELSDGRILPASLVACDPYSDLAVVYVNAQDLVAATFAGDAAGGEEQVGAGEMAGPVFDKAGRVKGFFCHGFESQQTQQVSAHQLMTIAAQLVENRCVSGRPDLGLQVQAMSNFSRQYWSLEYGVEIIWTSNPLLMEGDILLSINGQPLHTCHQLHRLLLDMVPGDSVQLEIFRAGRRLTVTVAVQQLP